MYQAALDFDPPKLTRPASLLTAARKRGDRAIAAGAAKAKSIDPTFIARACEHVLAYLRAHGTSSGELLTDSCKLAGIVSSDDRHFGAVFRALLGKRLVLMAGYVPRRKGHGAAGGKTYALSEATGA